MSNNKKNKMKPALQKYYDKQILDNKKKIKELRGWLADFRNESREKDNEIISLKATVEFQAQALRTLMETSGMTQEDMKGFIDAQKSAKETTKILGSIETLLNGTGLFGLGGLL